MSENAYPLSWPQGWPRAKQHESARFGIKNRNGDHRWADRLTVNQACERLLLELQRLGVATALVSSNMLLRRDNWPRSGQAEPADSGVAVYFTLKRKRIVFACDKWDRVADNIASIAAHIDAIRAVERYGVGNLEQAFRGYLALPEPGFKHNWREVLGDCKTLAEAEGAYREKAKAAHPDFGGNHTQMVELNEAVADARKEFAR